MQEPVNIEEKLTEITTRIKAIQQKQHQIQNITSNHSGLKMIVGAEYRSVSFYGSINKEVYRPDFHELELATRLITACSAVIDAYLEEQMEELRALVLPLATLEL